MKSRLAVSILFILIAASFTSDALGAFSKLRSLAGNVAHRFAIEACDQISSHDAVPRNKGSNESTIQLIQMDEDRVLGIENCSTSKFMTTAVRQVREVFALMSMK